MGGASIENGENGEGRPLGKRGCNLAFFLQVDQDSAWLFE